MADLQSKHFYRYFSLLFTVVPNMPVASMCAAFSQLCVCEEQEKCRPDFELSTENQLLLPQLPRCVCIYTASVWMQARHQVPHLMSSAQLTNTNYQGKPFPGQWEVHIIRQVLLAVSVENNASERNVSKQRCQKLQHFLIGPFYKLIIQQSTLLCNDRLMT